MHRTTWNPAERAPEKAELCGAQTPLKSVSVALATTSFSIEKTSTVLKVFKLRIVNIKLCFLKRLMVDGWKALPERLTPAERDVMFRVKVQVTRGACVVSSSGLSTGPS